MNSPSFSAAFAPRARRAFGAVFALGLLTATLPAFGAPRAKLSSSANAVISASNVATATAPTSRRLAPGELLAIVRTAVTTSNAKLPKGATVAGARAASTLDVPVAPSRVTIEVTPAPRRAGAVTTSAVLIFWNDVEIAARLPVALDLAVPPEALVFDVAKGGGLTLVIRRGLVEVSAPAVASVDGDVGDVIQVLLRPSGHVLRAQLIAKDRALAVEDGR